MRGAQSKASQELRPGGGGGSATADMLLESLGFNKALLHIGATMLTLKYYGCNPLAVRSASLRCLESWKNALAHLPLKRRSSQLVSLKQRECPGSH